jgi:preprotein translocase subunit YajC
LILATSEDIDYPHIDWCCKQCGEVYCYAGYPPETRCTKGHGHGWRPEAEQIEKYIDFLESLEPGDGIVMAGDGPAALMGPVESVGENELRTESIDSPSRVVRWDNDEKTIEWAKAEDENLWFRDVYHVDSVEIQSIVPDEEPRKVRTVGTDTDRSDGGESRD